MHLGHTTRRGTMSHIMDKNRCSCIGWCQTLFQQHVLIIWSWRYWQINTTHRRVAHIDDLGRNLIASHIRHQSLLFASVWCEEAYSSHLSDFYHASFLKKKLNSANIIIIRKDIHVFKLFPFIKTLLSAIRERDLQG